MPQDAFGPFDPNGLKLPSEVRVEFIERETDILKLDLLLEEHLIGFDSEWRPQLTTFDQSKPAILQLSNSKTACLVDLIALGDNPVLDEKLS